MFVLVVVCWLVGLFVHVVLFKTVFSSLSQVLKDFIKCHPFFWLGSTQASTGRLTGFDTRRSWLVARFSPVWQPAEFKIFDLFFWVGPEIVCQTCLRSSGKYAFGS